MQLELVAGALALIGNILMTYQVIRYNMPMNIATWGIWAFLNSISLMAVLHTGGPTPWLIVAYLGSSSCITAISLYRGGWSWGWMEALCSAAALSALALWILNPLWSLIASTSAMFVGGLPQLRDVWNRPETMPVTGWVIFLAAAIVSLAGAGWSDPAQYFYPFTSLTYTSLMLMAILSGRVSALRHLMRFGEATK
jgi:hypothetical protein